MKNQTEKKFGEKENYNFHMRLTKTQYIRLKNLAEMSGHKTISGYVRTNLLNPSIEMKINQILTLLQKNKQNS
jgi:hypothetical protein